MTPNSAVGAVETAHFFPPIDKGRFLNLDYAKRNIGTICDMISSAQSSVFMFLGDGEYLSNNLARSLERKQKLDVTLIFGPYVNVSPKTLVDGRIYANFALIDDLNSEKIRRYMRNTRTYDSNLVIVDGGREVYIFGSYYSKTQPLESGLLEHSRTILAESVPIVIGSVEPVRLSDGNIVDLINSYPNLNEFTRERTEEIVERERMKKFNPEKL